MLRGAHDGVMGHDPASVRRVALDHIEAYLPGDLDHLLGTVSPKGGAWAGLAPPDGAVVLRDFAEIRELYSHLLDSVTIVGGRQFVAVATDWYVFFEGVSTVRPKGGNDAIQLVSLTIFAHDDTGRTSTDMAWTFDPMAGARRPGRRIDTPALRSELVDLAAHEARRAAWAEGDVDAACRGLAPDGQFFLPCFDPDDPRLIVHVQGRDAFADYVRAFLDRFEIGTLRPANLAVGDSYVFAEAEFDLTDRRTGASLTAALALVEVLDDTGAVTGMLGYAVQR